MKDLCKHFKFKKVVCFALNLVPVFDLSLSTHQSTIIPYVTRSREMSHLSKISISIFLHHFLKISKCFILMQTPLQLDIWLQSYEGFDNAKNKMKQRNLNTVFANISKTISPTSDSFLLIMSHMSIHLDNGLGNECIDY